MVVLGAVFLFILITALGIPLMIYRGFVLTKLWAWFVVPLGVAPIGIAHAVGLSVLLSLITLKLTLPEKDAKDENATWWGKAIGLNLSLFVGYSLAWLLGSIVHGYM